MEWVVCAAGPGSGRAPRLVHEENRNSVTDRIGETALLAAGADQLFGLFPERRVARRAGEDLQETGFERHGDPFRGGAAAGQGTAGNGPPVARGRRSAAGGRHGYDCPGKT